MTPDTGLPLDGRGADEIVPHQPLIRPVAGGDPAPPPIGAAPGPGAPRRPRHAGATVGFALWMVIALASGVFIQALWSNYSGMLREIEGTNRRINEVSRAIQLADHQGQAATATGLREEWSELMRRSLVLYRSIEEPPSWLAALLGGSTGISLFQLVDVDPAEMRSHPEAPTACRVWAETAACRSYLGAATAIEEARRRDATFLSLYLLPMLWGLVGASIYVLRRVGDLLTQGAAAIPTLRYALRILLGGALGPLIGHILANEGVTAAGTSVVPFAAAFFAGYNIEAVLARLDNISAALGGKPREA